MKPKINAIAIILASAASLPAAVTINVLDNVPNGIASGGTGSGTGLISSNFGTMTSDLGMPVTTYTVSGVDLTSVGGGAAESFTFTVTYSQTGGTGVQFNSFGNVSVTGGDNNQVDGSETLTATIALASTTFSDLSLVGFTSARAGGVGAGETATFSWSGGSFNPTFGNTVANGVTGNSFTLAVDEPSTYNIEGFGAQFSAVPEPASASLLALGALALLRRRRL